LLHSLFHVLALSIPYNAEEADVVIWVLRFFSRTLSSPQHLIGGMVLTGPRLGGKSWVAAVIREFLGYGNGNLCKIVPGGFLCSPLRQDRQASEPLTASLAGKKLVIAREMPAMPLNVETVKMLVAGLDGGITARHNNSSRDEDTTFAMTFTLIGLSNTDIQVVTEDASSLTDKVMEVKCEHKLVAEPSADDIRERASDSRIEQRTTDGFFDGELLFWAQCLYPTLGTDVCRSRDMALCPAAIQRSFGDLEGGAREPMHVRMQKWMDDRLEACTPSEAPRFEDLKTVLGIAFPDAKPVHFTEAGLCEKAWICCVCLVALYSTFPWQAKGQHRVRGHAPKTFYKISLKGEPAGPVKLR
jgi:hypothetical protein